MSKLDDDEEIEYEFFIPKSVVGLVVICVFIKLLFDMVVHFRGI